MKINSYISSAFVSLATMLLAAGCAAHPESKEVAPVQAGPAATFERSAYSDRDRDYLGEYPVLPAPPPRGSQQEQQELQVVLKLQESRTPADVERINKGRYGGMADFAPLIGPWFTEKNLPKTHAMLRKYLEPISSCSIDMSDQFARLTPYSIDARVNPAVLIDFCNFSYPCTDSAYAHGMALVLADLFPDLREPILKRGYDVGWDRVISGEKFPSDVTAGRTLAEIFYAKAIKRPEFTHELEEVRAELSKARTTAITSAAK